MQSPEYEGEQLPDGMRTISVEASKSSARAPSLLRLNGLGSLSRANGLRLKNGDVIVAVNGQIFNGNENDLNEALTLDDVEARTLVTISRGRVMFDVLTAGPLGGDYEFAEPELANDITQAFQTYQVDAIDRYEPFEVMRKINRECLVFFSYSDPATLCISCCVALTEPYLGTNVCCNRGLRPCYCGASLTICAHLCSYMCLFRSRTGWHFAQLWAFPRAYAVAVCCRTFN